MDYQCFPGPPEPNPEPDYWIGAVGWIAALCILCYSGQVSSTVISLIKFRNLVLIDLEHNFCCSCAVVALIGW